jgi:hypothetical protein
MTTPVLPFESGIADYGVADFATVDMDYTSLNDLNVTYAPKPIIPVQIYSAAMVLLATIDDYQYFTWTEKWYDIDTWEFQVNRYAVGVDQIVAGGFVRYANNGYEHIGIIEKIESVIAVPGKAAETWRIVGRGVESILSQRIVMYATASGTGYHTLSGTAEANMRTYVDKECINASDTNRNITGLSLAADSGRGGTVYYSARFNPLNEVLYDICSVSGLSYGLTWSGSGLNFVFTIDEGADKTASVKLSPEFENVERLSYYSSIQDYKNLVYAGGTGLIDEREVQEVYDTTEPTAWNRREVFAEASDCLDSDELDTRGASILANKKVATSFEVDYQESNTFVYGTDFAIGDTVSVVFPGLVTSEIQLVSVTETINASGLKTRFGFGRPVPTFTGKVRDLTKETSAQLRR